MNFFLHEVGSEERRKQLSRYIVAYDGDICTTIDEETTHILCGEETEVNPQQNNIIVSILIIAHMLLQH